MNVGVLTTRSPDATPCDFSLWDYVKDQVYVPPLPANIPELKVRIRTAIETITADMLQTSFINPQPPTPLSATYPTTQMNIRLRHTDTTLRGCSTSPSIMTDYTMSGKPSSTLQKTNSQLPYSTN